MLSRHFLRAKVLQNVYAFVSCDQAEPEAHMRHFAQSIDQLNELGLYQLSLLPELVDTAERAIEDARQKFNPSEDERNPSYRLIQNRFIQRLRDNYDYRRYTERLGLSWSLQADAFRRAYNTMREVRYYVDYLHNPADDFETDKQFAIDLFRYLVNDDTLRTAIVDRGLTRKDERTPVERGLTWEDDFFQVAQYNFMMLKTLTDETFDVAMRLPLMYDAREEKDETDYTYAADLLRNTLAHLNDNEALIREHLQNWDFERVALMDILIINMAINELEYCPSIPERVTMDEYIELAKEFSTDKSKIFINGILEKLLSALRAAGRVNKSGRGLYDPDWDADESTPDPSNPTEP